VQIVRGETMQKKRVTYEAVIGVVVFALATLFGMYLDSPTGVEFTNEIQVSQDISTLGLGKFGDIKAVKIAVDGVTILNGSGIELMGGLDFTGQKDDVLVFKKEESWIEIGRFLGEV